MFPPHANPALKPTIEPLISPIAADSLLLGAVLAVLALGVLASLLVWVYQHTRHAALRSLWLLCASAAALQPSVPPGHSIPAPWAALALLLGIACSTAFWARTLALSAHSTRQQALWRAGLAAYIPAGCLGAWVAGSALQGLLLWHLLHLAWWAQAWRQQWLAGHASTERLGLTPMLLIVATALQHVACLGGLASSTTLTALWQWAMIFSVGHIALDAALNLPRTLRQTLADRDWQQALLLRYQESASQRLAQHTADLRRALNEAQHTDTRQRDMLTLVAQEFREPAAQMVSALTTLRNTAAPTPAQWDDLCSAAERVQFLSTQLLDHERWRTQGLAPQFTALNLQAWLQALLTSAPKPAAVALASSQEALTVEADPVLLDIAVRQLLQGACGPTPGTLRLRLSRRSGQAVLHIDSDTPSIPAALRARAFDRHLSLAADPRHSLGLGLVRSIALLHDGQVSLAEAPGGGTRFSLSLPLAPEQCKGLISLRGAAS